MIYVNIPLNRKIFMRTSILLLIVLIFSGCVSVSPENGVSATARPLVEAHRVRPGMGVPEVRAVLGDRLVIGYNLKDANLAQFEPIAIPQPYRQEEFSNKGHKYFVLYYNSFVTKPDGLIAEDELTPFIFENGTLLGAGLDALDQAKRQ